MKVYFESYGCTMNKGEALIMEALVEGRGHSVVSTVADADIAVLVTCVVIESTERRMRKRIDTLRSAGKPVVVAGCMASVVSPSIEDVRLLEPRYLHHINDVIEGGTGPFTYESKASLPRRVDDLRGILSIAEGCRSRCTYCITRLARGKLKSYPLPDLLGTAGTLVSSGCKEILLTGQDTAAYGSDTNCSLPELIGGITSVPGDYRIRIGMMNPASVMPILNELREAYTNEKVYKFLHLPVQSGSDALLRKMGRGYAIGDFRAIVHAFRSRFPDLVLSTDVIVGFPTESEEHFLQTRDLLNEIRPDIINITRFSPRPGTPAYDMDGKVHGRIMKERSRLLTKLRIEIGKGVNEGYLGRKKTVLVTERGKNGTVIGRMDNYKPVVLGDGVPLGDRVDVQLVGYTPTYLWGISDGGNDNDNDR